MPKPWERNWDVGDDQNASLPDAENVPQAENKKPWEMDWDAPEPIGVVPGMARAAGQGITVGFADELEAGLRAPFSDQTYSDIQKQIIGDVEQFRQESPVLAYGTEIASSMAVPYAGAGKAFQLAKGAGLGNLAAKTVAGATTGGAYGGLYGAGSSKEEGITGRLGDALTGAKFGAATGGLVSGAVVPGLSKLADVTKKAYQRSVTPMTAGSEKIAQSEAERRVAEALMRDRGQGISGRQFEGAQDRGIPVTMMEKGGETTRALARSAANQSPEARDILQRTIDPRFETQNQRISDALRRIVPEAGGVGATREGLKDIADQARKPLYKAAYEKGGGGIIDPDLARLETSPTIQGAMKEAQGILSDRYARGLGVGGKPPGTMNYRTSDGQQITAHSLEYWDSVKKALDNKIGAAQRAGRREEAADAIGLKKQLVNILDRNVPEYARARGTASTFFGQDDALTAGEAFATNAAKYKNEAARKAVEAMTPAEREMFKQGYASRMLNNISEVRDRRNVANNLLESTASRERAVIALGESGTRELAASIHIENIMDAARHATQGNSTTARQLVELGLIGGSGSYAAYTGDPVALAVTGILGGRRYLAGRGENKIAENVARLLTSGDQNAVREAVKKIVKQPEMLDRLKAWDKKFLEAGVWSSMNVPYNAKGE